MESGLRKKTIFFPFDSSHFYFNGLNYIVFVNYLKKVAYGKTYIAHDKIISAHS